MNTIILKIIHNIQDVAKSEDKFHNAVFPDSLSMFGCEILCF